MKNKQAVLDVLNSLEVIDSEGGEGAYALVEVNEEMLSNLEGVGVDRKTVLGYGDDGTTCILAIAFSEGYADSWDGNKLTLDDKKEKLYQENQKLRQELDDAHKRFDHINVHCEEAYEVCLVAERGMNSIDALLLSLTDLPEKGDTEV